MLRAPNLSGMCISYLCVNALATYASYSTPTHMNELLYFWYEYHQYRWFTRETFVAYILRYAYQGLGSCQASVPSCPARDTHFVLSPTTTFSENTIWFHRHIVQSKEVLGVCLWHCKTIIFHFLWQANQLCYYHPGDFVPGRPVHTLPCFCRLTWIICTYTFESAFDCMQIVIRNLGCIAVGAWLLVSWTCKGSASRVLCCAHKYGMPVLKALQGFLLTSQDIPTHNSVIFWFLQHLAVWRIRVCAHASFDPGVWLSTCLCLHHTVWHMNSPACLVWIGHHAGVTHCFRPKDIHSLLVLSRLGKQLCQFCQEHVPWIVWHYVPWWNGIWSRKALLSY